jgi:hypothetical protein
MALALQPEMPSGRFFAGNDDAACGNTVPRMSGAGMARELMHQRPMLVRVVGFR